MSDINTAKVAVVSRLLVRTILGSSTLLVMLPQQAQAQAKVVSACSGVSLPPSVVTGIISPVLTGVTAPIETTVNGILRLPLLGAVLPPLSLNTTGLLNQAAAGNPITLNVLATDGTIVGPADQCRVTSDSITLNTPAGVAIGGNQITGLGANGAPAFASDINAIAMGNNARAEAGATGSIAFGANTSATAANSVALGAGSVAARGALVSYLAPGLSGQQTSVGEVSIGAPGALRQITNVAAGTQASDAATVGQVLGVVNQVNALGALAVQYDALTRDRVTLAGAAGTTIANVAPGTIGAGSREAVNGDQLNATNQNVSTNTTAIANLDGRVTANTASIDNLTATTVRYLAADQSMIRFGGASGTVLDNIAPGVLASTSAQAVNGSQLFATNLQVAANTSAIAGLSNGSAGPLRYSSAAAPTVPNGGTVSDDTTLTGASGGAVGLHNLRDAVLASRSTDAVNGGQLFATNQAVAGNTAAIGAIDARVTTNEGQITNLQNAVSGTNSNVANLSTQVNNNTTAITNLNTALANQPLRYADAGSPTVPNGGTVTNDATLAGSSGGAVGLHNVRAGVLAAGSTDAVNGDQLATTNAQVAANTTAIANFNNLVVGSAVSPVQYSNPNSPTTPNGGVLTNDVTFVGANNAAPVTLHNVAGGVVAAGSTDAVNGQQLYAVATTASNSLQYDRDATGARTNRVTLSGGNAAAPVTVANVANGTVAAGSTEAVNGGQLYQTNQLAQQGATLGANSVQYDAGRTSVTLGSASSSSVTIHNVSTGVAATDAVNVGQLQASMQSTLASANGYTDARVGAALDAVNFDLGRVRRDIGAGTSAAMAAAALPQASEPGRTMVAIGGGTYRGQTAVAFGASAFLKDEHSMVRLSATYDSRGYGGASAGYGYQF